MVCSSIRATYPSSVRSTLLRHELVSLLPGRHAATSADSILTMQLSHTRESPASRCLQQVSHSTRSHARHECFQRKMPNPSRHSSHESRAAFRRHLSSCFRCLSAASDGYWQVVVLRRRCEREGCWTTDPVGAARNDRSTVVCWAAATRVRVAERILQRPAVTFIVRPVSVGGHSKNHLLHRNRARKTIRRSRS